MANPSIPGIAAPVRWTLAAFALALVGALLAIGPVALSPTDTIVCGWVHPDCLGNHWLLNWVAEQIIQGQSLVHNDRYYWPIGDAPWIAGNGSDGFLYLPWHVLLGWPAASTAHTLTLLTLNGLGAYALARAAGGSRAGSLAAAPTGAMMGYALHEVGAGRFSQANFGFLAFFLASWLGLLARPSIGRALGSAALLATTSVLYWYYGFFAVLAGAVLLLAQGRGLRSWPLWRSLLAFSLAYLAAIAPFLMVFAAHWGDIPGTAETTLFPHPETLGDSCWPWSSTGFFEPDTVPFLVSGGRHAGRILPFSTAILGFVALWRVRDRMGWSLAAVALLMALLMAGPLFPHGPYEQIYGLASPLRRFWWPYRHVVVLNLVWIALAARAFGPNPGRRATVAAVALALSIPVQLRLGGAPFPVPFSTVVSPVPFYQDVGKLPGTVLIEPPLTPDLQASQAPLIYSLDHGKALVGGHALWVDRVRPPAWDAFVDANSFLAACRRLERGEIADGVFRFEAADLQSLLDRDVRTFALNREYFPARLPEVVTGYVSVLTALFGEPAVRGTRAQAWDLGGWNGGTEATFSAFEWPKELIRGGPVLPMQTVRSPSLGFAMPPPPRREGAGKGGR